MNEINVYGTTYSREWVESQLKNFRQMKLDLANGTTTPRRVVGTGYKNSRLVAEVWIAENIARYGTLKSVMDSSLTSSVK
jgi:hypothetical protein